MYPDIAKRKILIIGESQKEKAYILGYSDEQIIIVNEQTPLHTIRHLIADNPQIKVILSPSLVHYQIISMILILLSVFAYVIELIYSLTTPICHYMK